MPTLAEKLETILAKGKSDVVPPTSLAERLEAIANKATEVPQPPSLAERLETIVAKGKSDAVPPTSLAERLEAIANKTSEVPQPPSLAERLSKILNNEHEVGEAVKSVVRRL